MHPALPKIFDAVECPGDSTSAPEVCLTPGQKIPGLAAR
jgi:hypothetical protein